MQVILNSCKAWFFAVALSVISGSATADLVDTQRLQDKLEHVQAFQANFTQRQLNSNGVLQQETQGEMVVKRPGLFYWRAIHPFEEILISDGKQLWFYDPELEQVTVQALEQQLSETPALLFSGEVSQLADTYEVDVVQLGEDSWQFRLLPKQPDTLFEELRLTFNKNTLVQMHMLDSLGTRSSFEFSDIQVNAPVDLSLFQFTPPEGVDVIESFASDDPS